MSEDKSLTKIPHFDGQHYDHWSKLMENLLRAKGLWSLVEIGIQEPIIGSALSTTQQAQHDDAKMKDHQVKHYLYQAIDRVTFEQILDRRTSKIVWDSLKSKFGGNAKVKKSLLNTLRRDFEILQMKQSESITEYFAKVTSVANQMRSNGETMPDTKVVEKVLRTLTERFTYVVVSIEESKDVSTMTIDELQSSLVVHEAKFKRLDKTREEEQALHASIGEGRINRGRGGVHFRGLGRGRGRQTIGRTTATCYKCHKPGHLQFECPTWERNAHYVELDDEEELLLMAHVDLELDDEEELLLMAHVQMGGSSREDVWFIDSGCSNHMTGNKKWFISLDENFSHAVKLGNNARMQVMGQGSVKLRVQGRTQIVSNVFYVPDLTNNLLSVGQLLEKGLKVVMQKGTCKIFHPMKGLIVHTHMITNRMFVMLAEQHNDACLQVTQEDLTGLWHRRFGHLHQKGL